MNQYNSYYLYQQYEKRGDQDWLPVYPNVFSVDGEGTMPLVIKKENDPDCGYVPPVEPMYRWYPLPISTDYVCDECPAVIYRWENINISTDYVCVGTDKYYKQKRQYSYDSGTTWYDVTPPETQTGSLYQTGSIDCGYVPPVTTYKFLASYSDSEDYHIDCNSSTELTSGETKTYGNYQNMTSAVIGNCVESIGQYAFEGCSGLTNCTIGSGVTNIGTLAFGDCTSLTSIDIPDNVTSIGYFAFAGCTSMISCTIGSGVTDIYNYAFYECNSLTSIDIPDNVTSIGVGAFRYCSGLTSCTMGSGVTSIGDNAFNGCAGLQTITIEATTPPTLGNNYVFGNTNDCPIYVPSGSVNRYKSATKWSSYSSRIQAIPSS